MIDPNYKIIHVRSVDDYAIVKAGIRQFLDRAWGFWNKALGSQIGIRHRSVRGRFVHTYHMVGINNRKEVVLRARSSGWISQSNRNICQE